MPILEPSSKRRRPNQLVAENASSMNHAVSPTITPTRPSEECSVTVTTVAERNTQKDDKKNKEDNPVVRQLLRDLRVAKSLDASKEAMYKLFQELHTADAEDYDPRETTDSFYYDDEIRVPVAKCIVESNGIFVIMMTLNDFHSNSNVFLCKTVRLLYLLGYAVPEAGQQLIESGAIRSLLKLANKEVETCSDIGFDPKRNFEYSIKSNMVGLLFGLVDSLDWGISKETVTEETLDFVISVTKKYPKDEYAQHVGIDYLLLVGKTGDFKVVKMLQEKKVGHLFVSALDQFRNDDSPIKKTVQKAMEWYTMHI
mmetsp:Transcript_29554/g.71102  ORF Transcript_29554/g.71102 Transcript_29554/m.71102 type:complete len:312 (+) Transcript_29554:343-1278(+)